MLQTAHRSNFGHLARRLDRVFGQMSHRHCAPFSPHESWAPAINAYRLADRFEVCVELAGLDPRAVEVSARPHQLCIRGVRQPPEPPREPDEQVRILTMEIDHGRFERAIRLPQRIDIDNVSMVAEAGLLWIRLPIKAAAPR